MDIFIVGNIVDFTYCKTEVPIVRGTSCKASKILSTIGNDAAIVAIVLAKLGLEINYGLLNPITELLAQKMKSLEVNIQNVEISDLDCKTILIESENEDRTYISAYKKINCQYFIPEETQYVYVDFYDESILEIKSLLDKIIDKKDVNLFINLSSSKIEEKCLFLSNYKLKRLYIQYSCKKKSVKRLITATTSIMPEAVFLATCGAQGSFLYETEKVNYIKSNECNNKNYIGSGAFFSSFFIYALKSKMNLIDAHNYASKKVGDICNQGFFILLDAIDFIDIS